MKVLYVNTYYSGGGAEKVMRQLYLKCRSEDIETYCVIGRYQANLPERVEVIYSGFFERVFTTLIGGCLKNTLLKTYKARKKIIEIIQKEKIDVVHFHNIHSNYLGIKDLCEIKKYCNNIMITAHDMWLTTGGCAHACECIKWKNGTECKKCQGNYSMKKFSIAHDIYNIKRGFLTNKGIMFVTPSKWLYDIMKQSYLKDENIRIVDNGIDIKKYSVHSKEKMRVKYGLPTNKRLILFVSNGLNNVYKGFIYLKKALELLKEKENYALIIVGNKQDENIDLPFEIYQMGYIASEEKMNELFGAADIYIHPSLADISSFTAMEAMASGTPVIAFRTGGIPEIVNEENGWLVEAKNVKELSKCIEMAFANREQLVIKSKKSREYIENNRSLEKTIRLYKELYCEMKDEESCVLQ